MSKGAKNKKKEITLLTLLANESTGKARRLLMRHGKEDAKDHVDLEIKLAELYRSTGDKISLEKEMADIHPHKNFILKHCSPKEEKKETQPVPVTETETNEKIKRFVVHDGYSNCAGNPNCQCECKSNACGCSGADGQTGPSSSTAINNGVLVLGLVSIVAIVGLVLVTKNKSV